MRNFLIQSNYRLRLKLMGDGPYLKTHEGIEYMDRRKASPGVANTHRLAERYCQGDGIDVGSSYFSKSRSNAFPGATPVDVAVPGTGQAEKLLQGNSTQDYVFASHVLEHLPDPEIAVLEAYRVLRHDGVLFTYSPFPGHPEWDPLLKKQGEEGHLWQPEPSSMCRLLIVCGFSIEYVEWGPDHLHSFIVIGRKLRM